MENNQLIPFPKREWPGLKKKLAETGVLSTIRCCVQLGRYKVGEVYETPWGDTIEITKVTRYKKPKEIPTWNLLDKGMKISVRMGARYGNNEWDHVEFKKIN